jgi:hypothetical protein
LAHPPAGLVYDPAAVNKEAAVRKLLAIPIFVALLAGMLVLAPAARANTLINCNPGLGSGPTVINTDAGNRRTKARVCVEVATDHQSMRSYVGYACEGLDGDGQWRAHNYCRWNPDPLELWQGGGPYGLKKSESTVIPPTGFTSNATWQTTWWNPGGCGFVQAIYYASLEGTSKVRYDNLDNPFTSTLNSMTNSYEYTGCTFPPP